MNPADYTPIFDSDVVGFTTTPPVLGPWSISEQYCLNPASAEVLATLFTPPPRVLLLAPVPLGGPFTYSRFVPWFVFNNGQQRNAGQLATYWIMVGIAKQDALAYAVADAQPSNG